ncbi:MAG: iron ABC transporter substrate-binding protein, partial [Chloroflexus sp.]|nr:iron ABC transporter substrate-binding protein [Chloroflexus sp.]
MNRVLRILALLTLAAFALAACGNQTAVTPTQAPAPTDAPAKIVIYSGRSESLVGPFFTQFPDATGIQVEVR